MKKRISIHWLTFAAAACMSAGLAVEALGTATVAMQPANLPEEYYTGGKMGTSFNHTSRALEMAAPAVAMDPKLAALFDEGEGIFEADFVVDPNAPNGGLGPVFNNNSCENCHPNYGRARRFSSFNMEFGNGYLALVSTPDHKIVDGFRFMLQTKAVAPYKPPAEGLEITWNEYVDKYDNKYPDGTPYNEGGENEGSLSYPTAKLVKPLYDKMPEDYRVDIEATIGLYGTGLLDAVPEEAIMAEYERQQKMPGPIKGRHGKWKMEKYDGKKHLGRFTWHNTRTSLENGPGYNGSWSVYNITRTDKPELFAHPAWIEKQKEMGLDIEPLVAHQPVELTDEQLAGLMIWFRGLAVPAARNLDDPTVKRGKEVFLASGCASCHKPSWVTGEYKYIPGYANQKIWPYTDLLMHDMGEINHGFVPFFRTPPLWGRGLMATAVDHTDMMHDLRARNFEEAILWHFGEGEEAREAFRNLKKEDRLAMIEFLKAI